MNRFQSNSPNIHGKMHWRRIRSMMRPIDCSPSRWLVCKCGARTIDALAYSTNARTYRYCWRSTNRNRSSGRQSATVHRSNSKMSGTLSRRNRAMWSDLVSRREEIVINDYIAQSVCQNVLTASLRSLSDALATSILENGTNEFFTDGIIHCWKRPSRTLNPITTSSKRFNTKRLRIREVLGKFSS